MSCVCSCFLWGCVAMKVTNYFYTESLHMAYAMGSSCWSFFHFCSFLLQFVWVIFRLNAFRASGSAWRAWSVQCLYANHEWSAEFHLMLIHSDLWAERLSHWLSYHAVSYRQIHAVSYRQIHACFYFVNLSSFRVFCRHVCLKKNSTTYRDPVVIPLLFVAWNLNIKMENFSRIRWGCY